MAEFRKYGNDLTYAEEHRSHLPELYERTGHRLNMLDIDFIEYCHYCREPLMLVETVRDIGQNLMDKNYAITRSIAERAKLGAMILAWRVDRSPDVEERYTSLQRELRTIERTYPISNFKRRLILPLSTSFDEVSPQDWWEEIRIIHHLHHRSCGNLAARRDPKALELKFRGHPLHNGDLFFR
jgi:hypothetical protein